MPKDLLSDAKIRTAKPAANKMAPTRPVCLMVMYVLPLS